MVYGTYTCPTCTHGIFIKFKSNCNMPCSMVEGCSPAVSEDRGHTSKVDGPESLAISICDVSYKLMNLNIILLLIHCLVDMPTSQARLSLTVVVVYEVLALEF